MELETTTEVEGGAYHVKTGAFSGPLSLLLSLIEKKKLHINDLSLAEVTEDYLNYINKEGNIIPEQASAFIVVAATLILIKSKSLLPGLDLSNEEEGDIKKLEERLRLYKIFTKLSGNVRSGFGKRIIFPPLERKMEKVVFLPDHQITRHSMMTVAREVLGRVPQKEKLPEIEVKKVISIEEMIGKITDRITNAMKFSFKDFTGKGNVKTKEEKVFVIVGFLAMLELVRNGILDALQEAEGEDIIIEKRTVVMETI